MKEFFSACPWRGLVLATALALLCPPVRATSPPPNPVQTVTLTTPDGVTLTGTFVGQAPCQRGAVLLHMLGRNRADWLAFQHIAWGKKICTLAVDLRGHGQSVKHKGKPDLSHQYFLTKDWETAGKNDAGMALGYFKTRLQKGAPPPAMLGASIGANLAILAASQHTVSGVAALSPGEDYKGVRPGPALKGLKVPVFFAAASDDGVSHRSTQALEKSFRGQKVSLYFTGAGHGTQLLKENKLTQGLLNWLLSLKTPKTGPKPR